MEEHKDRKKDHIQMAFDSAISTQQLDDRFYYEPLLAGHPGSSTSKSFPFLGKRMKHPLWISSMTGGTAWAKKINQNLARVCGEFGLGMGLGSCRPLLDGKQHFDDFDVRSFIGPDAPFFANIGIAQLVELEKQDAFDRLFELVERLQTDGVIVHVNPMQEWLQPEGDRYYNRPLDVIDALLSVCPYPIIVKEVGHGMGRESLTHLLQRDIAAIDFGANGGTNFSKLEMLRSSAQKREIYESLSFVGHSAAEMVELVNQLSEELGASRKCEQIIISGGVKDFLTGYYLVQRSELPAIYGQAASFLKHARQDYEDLRAYTQMQIDGYQMANQFLRVKPSI